MKPSSTLRSPWRDCLISAVGLCGSYAAWSLWFVNGGWHRFQHLGEIVLWAISVFVGYWAALDAFRFGRDSSPVKWLATSLIVVHAFSVLGLLLFISMLLHGEQPR